MGIATHAATDGWRVSKEFLCCLPGKTADFVSLYCGSGRLRQDLGGDKHETVMWPCNDSGLYRERVGRSSTTSDPRECSAE